MRKPPNVTSKLLFNFNELCFDMFELSNNLIGIHGLLPVLFKMKFSSVQGKSTFLDQVIYQFQVLDVPGGKFPVPLRILFGFQDVELLFPETDQ